MFIQSCTRMMNCAGIFCIFLAFSVQLKATSLGYICVTDYWNTISCSLKLPVTSTRNISYRLEARLINNNQNYSCQLQRVREDHICSFTVKSEIMDIHKYLLYYSEDGAENSSLLGDAFVPVKNIKPKTPFNLTLQYANGMYYFFWKSGYEDHPYRRALRIIYEFKYYKDGNHKSEVSVQPDKEMVQIDEMKLDPDTMYTVMVKSKIDDGKIYSGMWSDWSSAVKWKTAKRGYICVTDYWNTISCSLKLPVTSTRNISYRLEARLINSNQNYSCQLQRVREDHICSFTVKSEIMDIHKYLLYYSEDGAENSSLLGDAFVPVKNIKPKTPFNLTLQYANGMYYFFWKSGYEDHPYRRALRIIYEFKYYKDGNHKSEVSVQPDKEMVQIDEMKLDPDTMYTVMVKSKIDDGKIYRGMWSDWSSAVKWKTAKRDEPNQVSKIAIGMFSVVGILILLMSIPAARFKMKEISWVPTPATYFQPLYQNYQGNFQCWVLAKSPLQDFQVKEDFSTIDKISEVVTTLQDQVEKTGMYPTAQCHTPYVGPTAEVWAPCQMLDTRSETSIPCEEFSLFCEELPDKVDNLIQSLNVVCLSGDILSLEDSALSLECLEDCETSEAPVIINPVPLCFKQDYCTLTNTPTGPVPTFTRDVEQDENTSND